MKTRMRVAVAVVCGLVAACSGDSPSRSGNRNGSTAGTFGATAGTGVAGTTGTAGTTSWNPMPFDGGSSNLDDDGGTDCAQGTFCAPNEPDPDNCGSLTLGTDVQTVENPGNVLVVFDRSGSMDSEWGNAPKYEVAGNALIAALTPLKDLLTVGGVFFPSVDQGQSGCACQLLNPLHWIPGPGACCLNGSQSSCVVNSIESSDQINFGPADAFIAALPNQWRLRGASQTPLQRGLERAQEAIAARTFEDPLSVVIITDGVPNCNTNDDAVIAQVTAWASQGIKTHVIGLPGAGGAANLLNELAAAGGSGTYIDPADPQQLEERLRDIVSETIRVGLDSCTINLAEPTEVPEDLHLIVKQDGKEQDVPRDLSATASWSINAAGDTVVLEGDLCTMALEGSFETLRFEYGCVVLPPLPPPPPISPD